MPLTYVVGVGDGECHSAHTLCGHHTHITYVVGVGDGECHSAHTLCGHQISIDYSELLQCPKNLMSGKES